MEAQFAHPSGTRSVSRGPAYTRRMLMRAACLAFMLLTSACRPSFPPAADATFVTDPGRPLDRIVVVSVDGLRAVDSVRLPTIGSLARQSALAAPPHGALSVLPSVTYPSHTTMVTGVNPGVHGITTNIVTAEKGDEDEGEWRWYRKDIRVDTLYDAAFAAHLHTALIHWPVTVGARATVLIPEFLEHGEKMSVGTLTSLSTPGFIDELLFRNRKFAKRYGSDASVIDAAIAALDTVHPNLMFVHLTKTDHAEHHYGPDSPQAEDARLKADREVARLLAALRADKGWERTVLVIVSDHGFAAISRQVSPMVALKRAGLADRVLMNASGGFGYFYLKSPSDTEAEQRVTAAIATLAADPANGIANVIDRAGIAARGGDRDAFLGIESVLGYTFSGKLKGALVKPAKRKGTHGYFAERPEMRATLMFYGPRVVPAWLENARLLDLAPTLAQWLGLSLPQAEGKALPVTLK